MLPSVTAAILEFLHRQMPT